VLIDRTRRSTAENAYDDSHTLQTARGVHIPALDGLRGIASVMVVIYHSGPHIVREAGGHFDWLHDVPPFWFAGVDLFFVLSGFLISGILVEARHSPRYFRTFYARRAFRIFPLYYAVFAGYIIAISVLPSETVSTWRLFENPFPSWTYGLYLQNFAMAAVDNFGPIWMAGSWSLAVEEQFYLTLPKIIKTVDDRRLVCLMLGGIVIAPLLRAIIQKSRIVPGLSNYVLLPTHCDALAVGIIVMLAVRYRSNALILHRRVLALGTSVIVIAWSLYPFVPNPHAIRLAFVTPSGNAIAFGVVLLFLLVSPNSIPARVLASKVCRYFGLIAYSTYLFHPILLCIAFRLLSSKDPSLNTYADLFPVAAALLGTLMLASISWYMFESKLVGLGRRFTF
jgi:peptidoglycan/LPS O-acetylase OafA/YrhL